MVLVRDRVDFVDVSLVVPDVEDPAPVSRSMTAFGPVTFAPLSSVAVDVSTASFFCFAMGYSPSQAALSRRTNASVSATTNPYSASASTATRLFSNSEVSCPLIVTVASVETR